MDVDRALSPGEGAATWTLGWFFLTVLEEGGPWEQAVCVPIISCRKST